MVRQRDMRGGGVGGLLYVDDFVGVSNLEEDVQELDVVNAYCELEG